MNNIDNIVKELYERIQFEAGKYLDDYFKSIGVERKCSKVERIDYPEDPIQICKYVYDGKVILEVNFHQSSLGIEFLTVKPETREVDNG